MSHATPCASPPAPRKALRCALAALSVTCASHSLVSPAQTAPPTELGTLSLGMHWDDVRSNRELIELTRVTSEWERQIYKCGYRSARLSAGNAKLLVTTEDFVVTGLTHVTSIDEGSEPMRIAQRLISRYGRPQQTLMRDALGTITNDPANANYVELEFDGANDTKFVISGAPLWESRISIVDSNVRQARNRTIRCARMMERQQQEKASETSR